MRRKRTLGVNTSEDGPAGSLLDSMSPLSPMSQGTCDSSMDMQSTYTVGNASAVVGGTTSFVGSVIGHDDPTLIHANIKECFSAGINDSATVSSFLTEMTSDDIRDSSQTSRLDLSERQSSVQNLSDQEFLQKQLTELDKTQEQWKVRHEKEQQSSRHPTGREMDSTEHFYLEEVGEFHQQSTPRQNSLRLHEQTILEEDEYNEESSREPSVAESPTSDHQYNKDMLEKAKAREVAIASGAGTTAFGAVTTSCSVDSSVADSVPSDLVYEYPSTEESTGRRTPTQHSDEENQIVRGISEDVASHYGQGTNEKEIVIHEVQKRLYDLAVENTSHGTELQFLRRGDPTVGEREEPPSDQRRRGFKSWIPIHDDTERSQSWFRSRGALADKTVEQGPEEMALDDSHRKRKRKLCILNVCLILLVIAAIVCTILLTLSFLSGGDDSTSRNASVASPTTAPRLPPTNETPTFNLNPPTMAPTEFQTPTGGGPSPGEEITAPDNSSSPGGDVEDSDSSQSSSMPSSPVAPAPPIDPDNAFDLGASSPSPFPAEAPASQSVTGRDEVDNNVNPSAPPTPMVASGSPIDAIEGVILGLSGDSIYDPESPQYAAYQWLRNEKSSGFDLENFSEQELSQRYVAALFYFSLNGDAWLEKYQFLGESHVCEWNNGSSGQQLGIVCDSSDIVDGLIVKYGTITGIVLNENNLVGTLPKELKALSDLQTIQLRSNKVTGELPSELGNLLKLQEIDLRENDLRGTLPESVFDLPNIRNILLLRNINLGGSIPSTINKASNLEMLSFQKCQLTGTLPDSLGDLSKLFFVTFMDNKLSGTIPVRLAQLPMLEVLELSGNRLHGPIPGFRGQSALYFVSLFGNQLTGSIPVSLASLPGMLFLDIRDNLLTGSIPRIIGRLPDLVTFFAQNNELTGAVPSFSGNNGLLQAINLANNNLSGDLYAFFGDNGPTNRLFSVDLGGNNINGSIPGSIGSYSTLKSLILEDNQITGTIPSEIGSLTDMDSLVLKKNEITGTLPEEIGLMNNLAYLHVGENQFSGTLPDTLIMLPELKVLNVASNKLVGTIPTSFSSLSNISEFYLQGNDFQGDLTNTFCIASHQPIGIFASDCLGSEAEVDCDCCTICCNDSGCEQNV
ncbi:two component regulator [Nitzschia inconspicua]|uniref:Two component regulator n=1 Tax=Nitzschia inconspicua TaxID=303405 RepID=A0A9K3KFG4_9STRA|nr:two component regulator [Nitzschia inconspicua]